MITTACKFGRGVLDWMDRVVNMFSFGDWVLIVLMTLASSGITLWLIVSAALAVSDWETAKARARAQENEAFKLQYERQVNGMGRKGVIEL